MVHDHTVDLSVMGKDFLLARCNNIQVQEDTLWCCQNWFCQFFGRRVHLCFLKKKCMLWSIKILGSSISLIHSKQKYIYCVCRNLCDRLLHLLYWQMFIFYFILLYKEFNDSLYCISLYCIYFAN